ncbi:MAG: GntR family transcriptional regulator [Acidimicrobiales bacterium]|nr:GntR family transcriptional regulator [Acidimicrobiales bacterium]
MLLKVDHSSAQALHDQLAGQIRAAIGSGDLRPGERLPPAREVAAGLDVNVHTLLRALKTLRDEGLVDMRRGRGTVVTGKAPAQARFSELADELVAEARRSGLDRNEIIKLVESRL